MKTRFLPVLALASLAALGHADITVTPGNIPQTDENILFGGTNLNDALLITGDTNMTNTRIAFSGAGETLTAPSSGQARVEASDGSLTALTIAPYLSGTAFTSVILNLNTVRNSSGTVDFSIDASDGLFTFTGLSVGNGENFFTITATNGETINSLSFNTTATLADVRQVRIGVQAVPEPTSMAALGLGALGILKRRKKA